MMTRLLVSALACLSAASLAGAPRAARATTVAETPKAYRIVPRGTIEFSPSVSYGHWNMKREGYGNVDTFTNLEITPTVGYCLSDHYEVTGGFTTRHDSSNGTSETAVGTTAGLTYNFAPQGTFIPFASVGFGTLFYDGFHLDRTAVLAPMVDAGVRILVGSAASVNTTLGFQHEANAQGDSGLSSNRIVAGVGVSLFPWRSR